MISFVYFDVGGVVDLDFSGTNKWKELQEGIGVNEQNRSAYEAVWNRHVKDICIGYDVDTLIPSLITEVGLNLPSDYSFLQDFVNRFEPNPSIIPVIEKIKETHRVGLLTNMYPRMFPLIQEQGLLPSIEWSVVIDSSIVGLQKPDPKIFELAEEKAGVRGDQIFFVENSPEHIEAAKALGWHTFLYDSTSPEESSLKLKAAFDQL